MGRYSASRDQLTRKKPHRPGAGTLILAAGLALGASWQVSHAQSALAVQQTRMPLKVIGSVVIHGGPVSSGAVSTAEIMPLDQQGSVKSQTAGVSSPTAGSSSAAAAGAPAPFFGTHGLRIPEKEDGRRGVMNAATAGFAAGTRWSAALPPPPTAVPNPRGSRVIDSSSGVFGFNGLSQLDQRVAGTGVFTNTQFSLEPPDQGLCAGNGFVVEAVNNAIAVYDRSGNLLAGPEALSQFWGLSPEVIRTANPPIFGQFISDPKCAYDAASGRWFISELMQDSGNGGSGRNFNLIAVSQSSDPRGGFLSLSYDVTDDGLNGTPNDPGCPCFGDQPLLGFDQNGVYQTTNEFGAATFNGAHVYAIPKQGLIAAANGDFSHLYLVAIDVSQALVPYGGLSYSVQPAVSAGGDDNGGGEGGGVEYFLSALQFGAPPYQLLDNRVAVWALGNTQSLRTSTPDLTVSMQVVGSETYGQPNPAEQRPGPTPLGDAVGNSLELINTNDDRMNQVVYANGVLYGSVNTIIGDGTRTGIAWFGIAPHYGRGGLSGRVVQQGYVAVNGDNVIFPSIAFTADGAGAMAFTLVGADYFPSAAYVRLGDGEASPVQIAADGAAPDDGFTGYPALNGGTGNVGRWGDYSAAVADGGALWFATEYVPNAPRSAYANWGTFVGKLSH
ncbi:MAG: hypothetical protein KGI55_04030 [Gammaproteobacteria bacterium]|nr:hypothetical protein [Gammaproteobacteria bacterium]